MLLSSCLLWSALFLGELGMLWKRDFPSSGLAASASACPQRTRRWWMTYLACALWRSLCATLLILAVLGAAVFLVSFLFEPERSD